MHFLQKCLCLFLIRKRKSSRAFFELERVEEDSVLVIIESIVDFLIPQNSTIRGLAQSVPMCSYVVAHNPAKLTETSTSLSQNV